MTISNTINVALEKAKGLESLELQSRNIQVTRLYIVNLGNKLKLAANTLDESLWFYGVIGQALAEDPSANPEENSETVKLFLEKHFPKPEDVLTMPESTYAIVDDRAQKMLDKITSENRVLREQLLAIMARWGERYRAIRNILEIPDIVRSGAARDRLEKLITEILILLEKLPIRTNFKSLGDAKSQWKRNSTELDTQAQTSSYEHIKKTYQLREDTMVVINRLLAGEKLTLSEIDERVIADLYKFKQFSTLLTLGFNSSE